MNVKKQIKNLIQPKPKCVFQEKKETILKNKLEFLKIQLNDTHKRLSALKQANRQMRSTLADYDDQKQNNSHNMFNQTNSNRYEYSQETIIDKDSEDYQRNKKFIGSMKEMMEKKLKMVENQHKQEEKIDTRKIEELQNLIAQYKHLCEDAVQKRSKNIQNGKFHDKSKEYASKCFKKIQNVINIDSQKKEKLFDYSIVTYRDKEYHKGSKDKSVNDTKNKSISLINNSVTDGSFRQSNNRKSSYNHSNGSMKPSLSIGRLTVTRNDGNLNETVNSNIIDQSVNSMDRQYAPRLVGQKSFTKIITRIRCEGCQVGFGPNQYYRHIQKCNQKVANVKDRNKLSIKLKDILGDRQ